MENTQINKDWLKQITSNLSKEDMAQLIWDSMDKIEQQNEVFEIQNS